MDEPEGKTKEDVAMDMTNAPQEDQGESKKQRKKKKKQEKETKDVDDRYKGYELLLDIDESSLEPDIPIPKGQ